MSLISEVSRLRRKPISKTVRKRLIEFGKNKEWFSELCFCILTANSKAKTAISIQKRLGRRGFLNLEKGELAGIIRKHKHRFHNIKAGYICEAREFRSIRTILENEKDPREWLVRNVKGLGWKEASHFLRNVGCTDYAILDRHILNLMEKDKLIKKPKTMNRRNYLEIEGKLRKIAEKLRINLAELDLYMWYMETGEVLK